MLILRQRLARLFELEGSSERIRPMEGLRGLAVSLVFFVHYESLFGRWLGASGASAAAGKFLGTAGANGVDLFFVLSGYLIYGACMKSEVGYARFMQRRLRRIYPTFAVIFALYLGLSLFVPAENKLPAGQSAALFYVLENALLLPGLFHITPLITVAWSLSYEVFYYAFIPLLVAALGMRLWRPSRRALFFLGLAAIFAVACFLGAEHVQLILFASGILVYEASRSQAVIAFARRRGAQVIALAALSLFLPVSYFILRAAVPWLPSWTGGRYSLEACWLFAALFALTLLAFLGRGPVRSLFSAAPLRWLGNMSYSYYLVHGLTLKAMALAISRALPQWRPGAGAHWIFLPCAFAVTLASSAALFVLIEKRFSLAPRSSDSLAPALAPSAAAP